MATWLSPSENYTGTNMSEYLKEDSLDATLVESPNDTLQPPEVKDELPIPILTLPGPAVSKVEGSTTTPLLIFQGSISTNPPSKNAAFDKDGRTEQPPLKFIYSVPDRPSRNPTLDRGLDTQLANTKIASLISYHMLSEKIINSICGSLDRSSEDISRLIKNSETTNNVARIVEDFVSADFVRRTQEQKQEFNFGKAQPNSQTGELGSVKTVLGLYADIFPDDFVGRARDETCLKTCMAVGKETPRCGLPSKLNEASLNALVQELLSLPYPRSFTIVIQKLFAIVNMVFCGRWHRELAELAVYRLSEHFYKDMKSSSREAELKFLDQRLKALGQNSRPRGENVEVKKGGSGPNGGTILPNIPSSTSSVTAALNDVASSLLDDGVPNMIAANSLFLFEDKSRFELSINKDGKFIFAPTLTHKTFKPYIWAVKKRHLTAEELVKQIVEQRVTKADRWDRGYIYVYCHKVDFGYVKIGRTVKVERRLRGWAEQCKYEIDQCEDLLKGMNRSAPHPHRLEALIHAELKKKRLKVVQCEGCHGAHTEWFSVNAVEAQSVVKKWTEWMQKQPYDEHGFIKSEDEVGRPVVGDCERKSTPVGPKVRNPRQKSGRLSRGSCSSKAASQMKPPAASLHHMPLRSSGPLS